MILHLHNGIPWSSPSDPRRFDGLCHCRISIGECASAHVILFRCSSLTPESLPTCILNDTSHRQKNTLFRYSSASQLSCRSSTHMWDGPLHLPGQLGKCSGHLESISRRSSGQLWPIAFPHSIPWPGIRGRSSPNYQSYGWYVPFSVLSTGTDRCAQAFISQTGSQDEYYAYLHKKYGNIVRTGESFFSLTGTLWCLLCVEGPNEVMIRDPTAILPLMGTTGWAKGPGEY